MHLDHQHTGTTKFNGNVSVFLVRIHPWITSMAFRRHSLRFFHRFGCNWHRTWIWQVKRGWPGLWRFMLKTLQWVWPFLNLQLDQFSDLREAFDLYSISKRWSISSLSTGGGWSLWRTRGTGLRGTELIGKCHRQEWSDALSPGHLPLLPVFAICWKPQSAPSSNFNQNHGNSLRKKLQNILLIYRYKNAKGRSTTIWCTSHIHYIWLVNAMPCTSHTLPPFCQRSQGLPRGRSSPGFASELRYQCDILGCWYLERQRRIGIWDWNLEDLNEVKRSF